MINIELSHIAIEYAAHFAQGDKLFHNQKFHLFVYLLQASIN